MICFDPPSDELLSELREKHGADMREVEDEGRIFVLVKPEKPRPHLERMTVMASNDKKKLEACEGLVKACCAYPDKSILKSVLDDEPGMALSLAEPAMDLLGVRQLAVKKA
jgi:hypothetical protein